MSTYRYGYWISEYDVEYYSIDKKTIFGWSEKFWWHADNVGKRKMYDMVEQLKNKGHILYAW